MLHDIVLSEDLLRQQIRIQDIVCPCISYFNTKMENYRIRETATNIYQHW